MAPKRVAVVGGGIAGLAAATYLARGGARVTLLERSRALGGRARTTKQGEAALNLGPHALYRGGAAGSVLSELGVSWAGSEPKLEGAVAMRGGVGHALPRGFGSLVTTSLLPLRAKLEVAGLLARLGRIDTAALARTTVAEWLEATFVTAEARQLLAALFRLATYSNDLARTSAGAAIAQLALASAKGVVYLDGGWQSLVDGLEKRALEAGVTIRNESRVEAVEPEGAGCRVRLSGGERLEVEAVVIAASPQVTRELLAHGPEGAPLEESLAAAIPLEAASLDVVLSQLPRPRTTFALGIDRPVYLSVHSRAAQLAPAGQELVSLMKYLPPGEVTDAASDLAQLEELLDAVQPGWRDRVLERRWLPRLQVAGALVRADRAGLEGRPPTKVPGVAVWLAGDWVGREGMLADASLASAREATRAILATEARPLARSPA